jgi:hypothetical protein
MNTRAVDHPAQPGSVQDSTSGRAVLRRSVAAMIDGTGLEVIELANELAIINPHDPEKGCIHIEYASGYVSWERPLWEHWGPLKGYPDPEDSGTPPVGTGQILTTLGATRHRGLCTHIQT